MGDATKKKKKTEWGGGGDRMEQQVRWVTLPESDKSLLSRKPGILETAAIRAIRPVRQCMLHTHRPGIYSIYTVSLNLLIKIKINVLHNGEYNLSHRFDTTR